MILPPCYLLLTAGFLLLTSHFFIGCTPKAVTPVPPQYIEEFSLDEIVSRAGKDIQVLKAIVDIRIEKDNEFYDQINASVLIQRPDSIHMRIYKFGTLVNDFVMKEGYFYILAGKSDIKMKELIKEFFHAVLWWENLENGALFTEGDEYIIKTVNREIHLSKATLLPLKQDLNLRNKVIHVTYNTPMDYAGFWHPSKMELSVDKVNFRVTIDNLLKNPAPGEFDFKIPSKYQGLQLQNQ